MLLGSKELIAKLKTVDTMLNPELIKSMELSQNLVATHAKASHIRGKSLSLAERKEHPDERFYGWTQKLANSIHALKVKATPIKIEGSVVAGEKYAAKVETGGPNSRAFPFLGPAVNENGEAIIGIFIAGIRRIVK